MSKDILDSYKHTLNIAIGKEQEAYGFYEKAKNMVQSAGLKGFFSWLMDEEIRHEKILTDFREKIEKDESLHNEELKIVGVQDLGLGKYLVAEDMDEDSTYQDALILAMKREEKAVALFTDLEAITPLKELKKLYGKLREEEVKHLKTLEERYDEEILTEN